MAPIGAGMPTKKLAAHGGRSGSSIMTLKRASRRQTQIANTMAAIQPAGFQIVQAPEIEDQRRRDAEIDEVRETVEFGTEAGRSLEEARQTAVDAIEDRREHDPGQRQRIAVFEGHADGGQARAHREQSHEIRRERAHGDAAEAPSPRVAETGRMHGQCRILD